MKTFASHQFLAKIETDSAGGGHARSQQKSDMFMISDLAGRYADSGTIVDKHCAAGLADSA